MSAKDYRRSTLLDGPVRYIHQRELDTKGDVHLAHKGNNRAYACIACSNVTSIGWSWRNKFRFQKTPERFNYECYNPSRWPKLPHHENPFNFANSKYD